MYILVTVITYFCLLYLVEAGKCNGQVHKNTYIKVFSMWMFGVLMVAYYAYQLLPSVDTPHRYQALVDSDSVCDMGVMIYATTRHIRAYTINQKIVRTNNGVGYIYGVCDGVGIDLPDIVSISIDAECAEDGLVALLDVRPHIRFPFLRKYIYVNGERVKGDGPYPVWSGEEAEVWIWNGFTYIAKISIRPMYGC